MKGFYSKDKRKDFDDKFKREQEKYEQELYKNRICKSKLDFDVQNLRE